MIMIMMINIIEKIYCYRSCDYGNHVERWYKFLFEFDYCINYCYYVDDLKTYFGVICR